MSGQVVIQNFCMLRINQFHFIFKQAPHHNGRRGVRGRLAPAHVELALKHNQRLLVD